MFVDNTAFLSPKLFYFCDGFDLFPVSLPPLPELLYGRQAPNPVAPVVGLDYGGRLFFC